MSRNLHRIAGALETARRAAATGTCAIGACPDPAVGYIEGWDHPAGVCGKHAATAPAHGYTVHRAEDIPTRRPGPQDRP